MTQISNNQFANAILDAIDNASGNYHRLIIATGPPSSGKTNTLREVGTRIDSTPMNVNQNLSRELLNMTKRQRAVRVPKILSEIVSNVVSDVVLLDNIELLFDSELQLDPLRLLQGLSRNKTLVCVWSGDVEDGQLTYAVADHPEYRRYPIQDFVVISSRIKQ